MLNLKYDRNRIGSFVDAVFAIAMTLLILDVPVPDFMKVRELGFWGGFEYAQGHLIGYVVSFFVIALYWVAHVRYGHFIKFYTPKLIWLQVLTLFFVVLLAYTTAVYCAFFEYNEAFRLYCINLIVIGIVSLAFLSEVKKIQPAHSQMKRHTYRWMVWKALLVILVWIGAFALTYTLPNNVISRIFVVALIPLNLILQTVYKKKVLAEQADFLESRNKYRNKRNRKTRKHATQDAVVISPEQDAALANEVSVSKPNKPMRKPKRRKPKPPSTTDSPE